MTGRPLPRFLAGRGGGNPFSRAKLLSHVSLLTRGGLLCGSLLSRGSYLTRLAADNAGDMLHPLIGLSRGLRVLGSALRTRWNEMPPERRAPVVVLAGACVLGVALLPYGPMLALAGVLVAAAWAGRERATTARTPAEAPVAPGTPDPQGAERLRTLYEALVPYFSVPGDPSPLYAHGRGWAGAFESYAFDDDGRLTWLRLRYPASFTDVESESRARIEQLLYAKSGRSREYHFRWEEEANRLTLTVLPPLPTDLCAQRFVTSPGEVVLGFTDATSVPRTLPVFPVPARPGPAHPGVEVPGPALPGAACPAPEVRPAPADGTVPYGRDSRGAGDGHAAGDPDDPAGAPADDGRWGAALDVPPVVWRTGPRSTEPHLLALGQPGSGVTTLLRSVALQALRHGDVLVVDGGGTGEYACLDGRAGVLAVECGLTGARTTLEWAGHETERRLAATNRARQHGHPVPEDVRRPLWILLDRPSALHHLACADGRGDLVELLQVPLRHGRAAQVRVVIGDQLDATATFGDTVRCHARARVVLGAVPPEQVRAVLDAPPHTTPVRQVPAGRGYARLGTGPVLRLQVPATPDPYDETTDEVRRQAVLALLPERTGQQAGWPVEQAPPPGDPWAPDGPRTGPAPFTLDKPHAGPAPFSLEKPSARPAPFHTEESSARPAPFSLDKQPSGAPAPARGPEDSRPSQGLPDLAWSRTTGQRDGRGQGEPPWSDRGAGEPSPPDRGMVERPPRSDGSDRGPGRPPRAGHGPSPEKSADSAAGSAGPGRPAVPGRSGVSGQAGVSGQCGAPGQSGGAPRAADDGDPLPARAARS